MAKTQKYEDSLIKDLQDSFKSRNSGAKASYIHDSSTNVKEWISTGDFMLDLILSNRIDGGVPVGRLTEIAGGEGAGKTLLASYLLANTQKKGGVAILIDTECAASMDVLEKVGVNLQDLIYVQAGTTEEVLQSMETIITKIHRENSDKLVTIVWDSVAGTSTKAEVEGDYEAGKTVALQARLISMGLRKLTPIASQHNVCMVFINQLRTKIGVSFGDDKVTPGGKAIPYHASIRLRLTHYQQIKDKDKDLIGRIVKCDVKKNKVAPPMRSIYYTIRWGDEPGAWIDPYETMMDAGIRKGVFKKKNNVTFTFTPIDSNTPIEFSRKKFPALMEEDAFAREVKIALAEAYVITQKNISAEEVTYDDADGEEG